MPFLIPPEPRKIGAILAIFMATSLAASTSIEAQKQDMSSNELPHALDGDYESETIPQSEEDLRRTRDAKYGRELTEWQHREIRSWRAFDPEWWLDPIREDEAVRKQQDLRQLAQGLTSRQFRQAFERSDQTFGIEFVNPPHLTEETSQTDTVVRIKGRIRPDLFSLDKETVSFAARYGQLEPAEQAGFFNQVLLRSGQCDLEETSSHSALSDQTEYSNSRCGFTAAELRTMQQEFAAVMSLTVDHMRTYLDSTMSPFLTEFRATHSASRGALLDLEVYKSADRQALEILAEAHAEAAKVCRGNLSNLLLPGFVDIVIEGIRNQTLQMPLPTHDSVRQELGLLIEIITAQHVL